MGRQTWRSSPGCTGGGQEAEELFQLALSYENGIRGMPRDIDKAIKFYEESMNMGNPKAAINLGTIYRTAYASLTYNNSRTERFNYMNAMYEQSIKMGCPDGYYFLALSHAKGWGFRENQRISNEYIMKGVEAGSLPAMADYGLMLKEQGKLEEAKKWLHMAVEGGFGPAAYKLSTIYWSGKNYEQYIDLARQGAKLGDVPCLYRLSEIYRKGAYGQIKDEEYSECFYQIYKSIDQAAPPPFIDNLDELCPPRPVIPYKYEE